MSESPHKPPYITVGHCSRRAATGTADFMKNITSERHEEITRLFHVIERFSLQHIHFDEKMGFLAAKKLGCWNVFPTATYIDERTDVFAYMSSGLIFSLLDHNAKFFFSTTTVIKRGQPAINDDNLN
jgi:hypothetical protein